MATESKQHTPGPWTISVGEPSMKCLRRIQTFEVGGKREAVWIAQVANDGRGIENARLIAAAPDMLGVLREFPRYPSNCCHEEEPWYCDCCRHEWELALKAWKGTVADVIRKATEPEETR